jgi:predicted ester cyclase
MILMSDLYALKAHFQHRLSGMMGLRPQQRSAAYAGMLDERVSVNAFHPVNQITGRDRFLVDVLSPLWQAFPDLERVDDIILTGRWKDAHWTASTGHWVGTFESPWLGIKPTHGAISLRYGEFMRWHGDRVIEMYWIVDMLDFMRQAGCYPNMLTRPRGITERHPPPPFGLGTALTETDDAESQASLSLVEAMIAGLMSYDQKTLESMGMERFWHPEMMWYGPGGIGTSRRLKGFQDVHQRAFLEAFPDRIGGDHKCRIGDATFVASTGWPSVRATHRASWLGAPATQQRISMRVMDFWRREGSMLRENWVFIDQLELLLQMGIDVLGATRA